MKQSSNILVKGIVVGLVIAFIAGMVLAFNTGFTLEKKLAGTSQFIGGVVSLWFSGIWTIDICSYADYNRHDFYS